MSINILPGLVTAIIALGLGMALRQWGGRKYHRHAVPAGAAVLKEGLVRYQVSKTNGGPSYHEWPAVEFVGRMAALVPPARKHVCAPDCGAAKKVPVTVSEGARRGGLLGHTGLPPATSFRLIVDHISRCL